MRMRDASQNTYAIARLLGKETQKEFIQNLKIEQENIRKENAKKEEDLIKYEEAKKKKLNLF